MIAITEEGQERLDRALAQAPAGPAPRPLTLIAGYGTGTPSLVAALERAGFRTFAFGDFASALPEVPQIGPDLVLVGESDPGGDPFTFLLDLQAAGGTGIALFLTRTVDWQHVSRAMDAGAHDVVAPPHSLNAILLRRHVQEKRRRMPRPLGRARLRRQITLAGLTVDLATREVSDGATPFTLSGRELELLVRLMEAQGDVVTRERLLADIWGDDQGSEAVLDATVHRLRRRLGEQMQRPDLVATVRGVGYRLQAV